MSLLRSARDSARDVGSWLALPRDLVLGATRGVLQTLDPRSALDLVALRRLATHSFLVGLFAGLIGAIFLGALEVVEHVVLQSGAGYQRLRAHGERVLIESPTGPFRPWLLAVLPALGGLASGLLTRFAPEARGAGTDAMIDAFHRNSGVIRPRVIWVKMLATISVLGTGGAGGREGPTIHIGGAVGSYVSKLLRLGARERRILLVAGAAAGISAVFRTPLGAALLAVEILYRDGFESDALIPSVLASVTSYSVVISTYGESTLFSHAPRYPFTPSHLPLYGLLAVSVAILASALVAAIRGVRSAGRRLGLPRWVRPAVGGLALGVFATPLIVFVGARVGASGQGLGLLGGGYGAAQMAIEGSPLLGQGWEAVEILLLLCIAKLIASALTIGSGASAGDFAPSLALGGLFGGAFGHAGRILLQDPRIDPGAFALVGMGAFYGGIAHVPIASLVMVCELAGSYDLLVPLMLAEAVAFVVLRKRTLYPAQVPTPHDSPVHQREVIVTALRTTRVSSVMTSVSNLVHFAPAMRAHEMSRRAAEADREQDVFPVLDSSGVVKGIVTSDALRSFSANEELRGWALAADVMQFPASVRPDDDLAEATRMMRKNELREVLVIDGLGKIVGLLDAGDIAKIYVDAAIASESGETEASPPPREDTDTMPPR